MGIGLYCLVIYSLKSEVIQKVVATESAAEGEEEEVMNKTKQKMA